MKSALIFLLALLAACASYAAEHAPKPVVLIAGEGNLTVTSTGTVAGASHVATGIGHSTVSKHDQTMEMAQDLLQYCPEMEVTLDQAASPDYYLALNREGGAYNIGQSQIMALNRRKTILFVAKKGTVKNAVRSACNAMMADWQANGRLAAPEGTTVSTPVVPGTSSAALPVAAAALATTPPAVSPAKQSTVSVNLQTTAAAQKRCKPQTISDAMSDITAYLTAKGVALGTTANSAYSLTVIVDRPAMKWIQITMQARDDSNHLLWSDTVSDGGWGHAGTQGLLNTMERLHHVIDSKLGQKNGLPLLPIATKTN